jgi:hypothetical protein
VVEAAREPSENEKAAEAQDFPALAHVTAPLMPCARKSEAVQYIGLLRDVWCDRLRGWGLGDEVSSFLATVSDFSAAMQDFSAVVYFQNFSVASLKAE